MPPLAPVVLLLTNLNGTLICAKRAVTRVGHREDDEHDEHDALLGRKRRGETHKKHGTNEND
jgi:hypothetical protein